VKTIVTLSTGD